MAFGTKKTKKVGGELAQPPKTAEPAKKAAKPRKKRLPFDPKLPIAGKASAAQLKARIEFLEDQVRWHQDKDRGAHGGGKAARSKN